MTDLKTNAARPTGPEAGENVRSAAASFLALSLLVLIGGAFISREEAAGPDRVVPPREPLSVMQFAYREHAEPDRTVSSIEFRLEARGENTAEMVVEAKAVGPLVQPPRGFRYRAGENPITAREIAELEAAERLEIVTTDRADGTRHAGEIRLGELHVFSERKIALDGTLKDVRSRELPSSLRLASGALEDGEYEFEVFLDGAPRLQLQFQIEDDARRGSLGAVRALHPEDEELEP